MKKFIFLLIVFLTSVVRAGDIPINYNKNSLAIVGWGQILDNAQFGTFYEKSVVSGQKVKNIWPLCSVVIQGQDPPTLVLPSQEEIDVWEAEKRVKRKRENRILEVESLTPSFIDTVTVNTETYKITDDIRNKLDAIAKALKEESSAGVDISTFFPIRVLVQQTNSVKEFKVFNTPTEFSVVYRKVKKHVFDKELEENNIINSINNMSEIDLDSFIDPRL